jgi:hypothetical protein
LLAGTGELGFDLLLLGGPGRRRRNFSSCTSFLLGGGSVRGDRLRTFIANRTHSGFAGQHECQPRNDSTVWCRVGPSALIFPVQHFAHVAFPIEKPTTPALLSSKEEALSSVKRSRWPFRTFGWRCRRPMRQDKEHRPLPTPSCASIPMPPILDRGRIRPSDYYNGSPRTTSTKALDRPLLSFSRRPAKCAQWCDPRQNPRSRASPTPFRRH